METDCTHQADRTTFLRFATLLAIALPCLLFLNPTVGLAPRERPKIKPGGNNRLPSAITTPRALITQDLNSGLTPTDLVTALLGSGVTVSNVTFTGANVAAGKFQGGTGIVGFDSGIILSSGDISFVPGQNTQDDVSGVNAGLSDPDLDALIPGYSTFDACVLEFDFECTGTQVIQFQYAFSSEEYNEWVNSPFNDVFGFFLNGVNIALVPGGGTTPVSINNVNCNNPYNPPTGSFCNLFINNDCSDIPPGTFPCNGVRDTQMDGLIVVLTATANLNPGINHIKLAVADAGDQVLDSNVFILGQSFTCGQPTGACCDTVALSCTDNVPQSACQGPNKVWSVGLACSQLNPPCTPVIHPGGTDCTDPIVIPALPFFDINNTADKGNDYSSTCLDTYDNGNDILYELTISSTRCVDITVTGASATDNWIGVALDTACPPGLSCVAQATTSTSIATISNLTLTPGTYYLMIDRWPVADDSLRFTLSITDCGTPIGACCNTTTGACTDNVPRAGCQGANQVWSAGMACHQLTPPCAAVTEDGKNCQSPIPIVALPYTNVNTTCGKIDDYSNTCLGTYDDGEDALYALTISAPTCVDITLTGATVNDSWLGVAIDSACPPGLTCLAQGTTTGTVATINHLMLAPGTYYLMVDNRTELVNCVNFTLSVTPCPATTGACCFSDGHCQVSTEAACQQGGGLGWTAGATCNPSPCPYVKGDVNCDHAVNSEDIPAFVAALVGNYAGCDITLADLDDSGKADGADIQLFVNVLMGP